ncbi:hypothetical protein K493DRAFT_348382 [Basidiobolus meristosporus CBS 931.73]|uniref:Protein PNS1 n=1 Tax=Basidiobolus meristosporus CBS 931.73 TaxID=1314790 RepID=A0A1Y1YPH7_9FUNG|nr:hypothetical protein K493DRAFT_348382 [Basidiobolus meristosporus CBS 931.73]|eukprot:ORX99733.1 hypothetical protein K493DRAFT_348382 [Basidiobolus meristosporus CBS 931.73]
MRWAERKIIRIFSLSIFSLVPLSLSLLHSVFVLRKRKEINANINIIQLSFDVLANNPEIISISVLLLGSYIFFCAIWLIFFSRVFLVKHSDRYGNDVAVESPAQQLTTFFVFVFFWTTAVFNGVHRATVAGVVSQWYFHR